MEIKDIAEVAELVELLRKLPKNEREKVLFMVKGILIATEQV